MAKLIYSAIASLDGYVEDKQGDFDWAAPDEEVHAFVNDLERPNGTYLYGRRMYETMVFWETVNTGSDQDAVTRDFALPQTSAGWTGFIASSLVYGFAMIAFFIAVSMIGPMRASLLSYADAVISAGLGVIVLGQALTMFQVAGIALVIIALVGATRR